jgi:redox-sensing transcriptional repressor
MSLAIDSKRTTEDDQGKAVVSHAGSQSMSRDPSQSGGTEEPKLSRATVGRLSLYLRHLESLAAAGTETVSSGQLGEDLGLTDAQIRKDLAALGSLGFPGVGYHPPKLIEEIRKKLGLDREWNVVLVGAGNLARALLRYRGFRAQGFHVVGVFDNDPAKLGQQIDDLKIESPGRLPTVIAETGARLGIVTVPAAAAQAVTDTLVAAGVSGILNFAPTVLRVPEGVSLVSVDLTVQLEQLAFLVLSDHICV